MRSRRRETAVLLVFLALGDAGAQESGNEWTQAKLDARRSGNASDRDVGESLGLLAAVPMTDAILTSPVVAHGKIYVVDASGRAACIDATTFKLIWQFE